MDQTPSTTAPQSAEPPPAAVSATNSAASATPRPSFNTRPWQQPSQPFTSSPFSLPSSPLPPSSTSAPSAPGSGGLAIGVPSQSPPAAALSSLASPAYAQQPPQPVVTMGTPGSRPGVASSNQLRPSLRPQTSSSSQSPIPQNFQGHNMLRASSLGSPISPSPSISQAPQVQNQPWLSSTNQAKPPLPSAPFRAQNIPQSFQQRSHIPQPPRPTTPTMQQQQQHTTSSSQQQLSQSSALGQPQEHFSQQFTSSRAQQPLPQQQIARGPGLGSQRPPPVGAVQPSASLPQSLSKSALVDNEETANRLIGKRTVQEIANQVNPSEKLDTQAEDMLVNIAEDFARSIADFGCSLAKHRKSATFEAKDVLLHFERNWNMTIPGFGGDDIRTYKKPIVSDIHRERLAAIKKSHASADAMAKISGANARGGHTAKGPSNAIGSPPNTRIRDSA